MIALGDPVGTGLVDSLSRPGGNVTGMSMMVPELATMRLELLKEAVPGISRVLVLSYLVDPDCSPSGESAMSSVTKSIAAPAWHERTRIVQIALWAWCKQMNYF
jgi:ABC-type uncharacterized transport system substrate-binding protein